MCLNKVPVRDKETNLIHYYACNYCAECINNKARRTKYMCDSQFKLSKYSLFVTLTYAPEFLPQIKIFSYDSFDEDNVPCKCVTYYSMTERVTKYFGSEIIEEKNLNEDSYYKFMKPLHYNKFNLDTDVFGFLFRPDVQLFMKRLRERLTNYISSLYYKKSFKKLSNYEKAQVSNKVSELKSFICGEYGPQTFRPHFHLLLYFDSDELFDFLFNNVDKIWKYGRVDVQPAGNDANGYVSGYVNSYVSTPALLRTSFARPFSQHSLFFGVNVDEEYNKEIRENGYKRIREKLCVVNGRFQNFTYPRSLENLLYPKTYRFTKSSDYQLLRRYTAYESLSRYFGETSIKKLVTLYINNQNDFYWLNTDFLHNTLTRDLLIPFSENEESTLTQLLLVSKKFLRNCDYFKLRPQEYINLIKDFYNEKNSSTLHDFYKKLCSEQSLYGHVKYLSSFYDNIPTDYSYYFDTKDFCISNKNRRKHYLIVKNFAKSVGVSVSELFNSIDDKFQCSYIYDKFQLQEKILRDNQKHKQQNDLNKIFIYE